MLPETSIRKQDAALAGPALFGGELGELAVAAEHLAEGTGGVAQPALARSGPARAAAGEDAGEVALEAAQEGVLVVPR
jgi:hypothetical protein